MTPDAVLFDLEAFLLGYDAEEFSSDQWKILRWCKTKEDCDSYIDRLPGSANEPLIPIIKLIKSQMKGGGSVILTPFQQKCHDCITGYEAARSEAEKRRYTASLTRKAVRNRGWQGAIESIVVKDRKSDESTGFEALKVIGRLDASFEAFVIGNKNEFSEKAYELANARLLKAGFSTS